MGAPYEITLSALLKGITRDLADGTDTCGVMLRDIADGQMKFEGIKEAGTDIALGQVPKFWGAITRAAAQKLSKVTIPAED